MEQAPFPAEPSYQPALVSFKALLKVSVRKLWREKFREYDARGAAGCPWRLTQKSTQRETMSQAL